MEEKSRCFNSELTHFLNTVSLHHEKKKKKKNGLLFHMVQSILIYIHVTWSSSYVVHTWILVTLKTQISPHKSIYAVCFSSWGQSLNTYLCFRNTQNIEYVYTKKYIIFCSVQINSWIFTPWLMDNSWKLHMHEALRAHVMYVCARMHVCVLLLTSSSINSKL